MSEMRKMLKNYRRNPFQILCHYIERKWLRRTILLSAALTLVCLFSFNHATANDEAHERMLSNYGISKTDQDRWLASVRQKGLALTQEALSQSIQDSLDGKAFAEFRHKERILELASKYDEILKEINKARHTIRDRIMDIHIDYKTKQALLDASLPYLDLMLDKILFPVWLGTAWSLGGNTAQPHTGPIACGYFLKRILSDVGFTFKPGKGFNIAQLSARNMIWSYADGFTPNLKDFAGLREYLKKNGPGLYIIGISPPKRKEGHVLFLRYVNDQHTMLFHSGPSAGRPFGVYVEDAEDYLTRYYPTVFVYAAKLNRRLVQKWMGYNDPILANKFVSEIKGFQTKLKDLGYSPGPVDGIPGPQTKAALKTFQTEYNLRSNGFPDKRTLFALDLFHNLRGQCSDEFVEMIRGLITPALPVPILNGYASALAELLLQVSYLNGPEKTRAWLVQASITNIDNAQLGKPLGIRIYSSKEIGLKGREVVLAYQGAPSGRNSCSGGFRQTYQIYWEDTSGRQYLGEYYGILVLNALIMPDDPEARPMAISSLRNQGFAKLRPVGCNFFTLEFLTIKGCGTVVNTGYLLQYTDGKGFRGIIRYSPFVSTSRRETWACRITPIDGDTFEYHGVFHSSPRDGTPKKVEQNLLFSRVGDKFKVQEDATGETARGRDRQFDSSWFGWSPYSIE